MSTVENEGNDVGKPFPKIKIEPYEVNFRPTTRPGVYEVCGDPVNHPSHYQLPGGIEVIDLIKDESYLRGNILKYVFRAPHKGNELQDMRKAMKYLEWEIERLEKEWVRITPHQKR